MGFFETMFGSNEFSAADYNKQKSEDYNWQVRAAREMPSIQRQGLEAAGYNPLLGQQASSAVELSAGGHPGSGAGQPGEDQNSAMTTMQMASARKDMQIKDAHVDIAKAEADIKKGEADEVKRHNKEQEQIEKAKYSLNKDLNKEVLHQNAFNEKFRKKHSDLADVLDYVGWSPYGFVGHMGKSAIGVFKDVLQGFGFLNVANAIKKIGLSRLKEVADNTKDLRDLLLAYINR